MNELHVQAFTAVRMKEKGGTAGQRWLYDSRVATVK